jgi:hypothetical protein
MKNQFAWLAVGFASGALLVWPISLTLQRSTDSPAVISGDDGVTAAPLVQRPAVRSQRRLRSAATTPAAAAPIDAATAHRLDIPVVEIVFDFGQAQRNSGQMSRVLWGMMVERDLTRARLTGSSYGRGPAGWRQASPGGTFAGGDRRLELPAFEPWRISSERAAGAALVVPTSLDLREQLRSQYGVVAYFGNSGGGGLGGLLSGDGAELADDIVSFEELNPIREAAAAVPLAGPVRNPVPGFGPGSVTSFDDQDNMVATAGIDPIDMVIDVPAAFSPERPLDTAIGPVQVADGVDPGVIVDVPVQMPGDVVAVAGVPPWVGPVNSDDSGNLPEDSGEDSDMSSMMSSGGDEAPPKDDDFMDLHGDLTGLVGASGGSGSGGPMVPEPASLAMLAFGSLLALRRRS